MPEVQCTDCRRFYDLHEILHQDVHGDITLLYTQCPNPKCGVVTVAWAESQRIRQLQEPIKQLQARRNEEGRKAIRRLADEMTKRGISRRAAKRAIADPLGVLAASGDEEYRQTMAAIDAELKPLQHELHTEYLRVVREHRHLYPQGVTIHWPEGAEPPEGQPGEA